MINKIIKIFIAFKVIIQSVIYKKKIFLFCVPYHGNIGDHAIALAEEKIFEEYFSDYKLIEVETAIASKILSFIKPFVGNSTICITGGGLLGNLWMNEELTVRKILSIFNNNKIIIFPSTIYYSDDEDGKKELELAKKIYNNCTHLSIFAREINTFNLLKNHFKKNNLYLVPDIVLSLKKIDNKCVNDSILLCLRKDKEKLFGVNKNIKAILGKYGSVIETTTVVNEKFYTKKSRNRVVINKIQEFGKSKFVFTDRLHGMIFAYLSKTPCIAMDNKSHKVSSVYEWIKDCHYIKLYNENTFENDVIQLLSNVDLDYNIDLKKFDDIKKSLKRGEKIGK